MGRKNLGVKRRVPYDKAKDRIPPAPTYRLRDLLRLGNNATLFRNLKQRLYRIADKHLVLKYAVSLQTDKFSAIENELLSTLPDIFDGENSEIIELALQLITAYHYRRRFASRQYLESIGHFQPRNFVMSVALSNRTSSSKGQKAAKNLKENDITIIDLTLDDGKHDEMQKDNVEVVEPKLPLMTDISNRLPGPATIKRAPTASPEPSSLRAPAALVNSQNTPLHAESSSQAQSSKNASVMQGNHEDAFQLTGATRIARFLNACSPPMAHFLQPLINFGCTSEEYLVAVSTWPTDKILNFLNQVVRHGSVDQRVSQMDILMLQNHFISYFNKSQT